jgi:hypothetical protein
MAKSICVGPKRNLVCLRLRTEVAHHDNRHPILEFAKPNVHNYICGMVQYERVCRIHDCPTR